MILSKKAVNEFKALYESGYGEKLADIEARLRAENFIKLFSLLIKPISKYRSGAEKK